MRKTYSITVRGGRGAAPGSPKSPPPQWVPAFIALLAFNAVAWGMLGAVLYVLS